MQITLALALLAMPSLASAQTLVNVTPTVDAPVVTVSVNEVVDATPDVATVAVGVSTLAPTAQAALTQNSTKMTRVIQAIRAAGASERDVQTRGISINAEYDYQNRTQVFRGYRASNQVSVRTKNIAGLGRFLDAMIAAGGNQVEGPYFSIDRPEPLREQARDRALQTANAQANSYALRMGFKRARLLSLTEGVSYNRGREIVVTAMAVQEAAAPSPPPPPVAPGVVGTGVTVTATYRLD